MHGSAQPASTAGRMVVLLLTGLVVVAVAAPPAAGEPLWHDLLERAVDEGQQRAFEGRLVVVSFDAPAPVIGEATVTQDADGAVMTSRSASWILGRERDRTFFGDADSGTLLRLGSAERTGFSVERLDSKYDVAVDGTARTVLGDAVVLTVREADELRERLFVDPASGLLVRRETYGRDGRPARLVAFTSLDLTPGDVPDLPRETTWREVDASKTEVSTGAVDILRDVGWAAPAELPGGFDLIEAGALGDEERSTLHLVYSDGLYAVSLYEQHGRLDAAAMVDRGARASTLGAMHVYRWPGAEPTTVVWTGQHRTFTAVSDAPLDVLRDTLAALPHEPPAGPVTRVRRGLRRVADWVWPFG